MSIPNNTKDSVNEVSFEKAPIIGAEIMLCE
jgi:hypothetical protein